MTPNPAIVAVADAYEGFMSRYTPFAWGDSPVGARNGVVAGQAACRRVRILQGPESHP